MRTRVPAARARGRLPGLLVALLVTALVAPACRDGAPPAPAREVVEGAVDEVRSGSASGFGEEPRTSPDGLAPLPRVTGAVPFGVRGDIVFQSDIQGRPKIFVLNLPTGLVTQLTSGSDSRDETPRWSPDGSRILFASTRAYYGDDAAQGEPAYDIHVMDADGRNIRRLTSGPGNDRDPAWFPDGRSIVYWSDAESRGDLYRLWLDDGRIERLTHNFVGRAIMPTVSPDGTRVAFASQTLRVGAFWNYQVQVLDLETGAITPVGLEGGTCWPVWFRDGRHVGFVQLEPGPSRIQRRAIDGDAAETIATYPNRWLYYPRLSPDERWMVVSTSPEHHDGEDWDLALVPLDGSNRVTPLTTGRGNDRLPDWRPEPSPRADAGDTTQPGSLLVFQSDRDGRDKIYAFDTTTGSVRALTTGADHRDEEPALSPDGRRVAFHTNRFDPATYDIAVMDLEDSRVQRLTDHQAWDQDPVWMPDGGSLVFTSERDGTGAIFRVYLEDGRVERLSRTADRAIMPAVSPDGRRVAYAVATSHGFQIAVLDLATGEERQVTRVDGGACRPAWAPDGRRLAYVRMQGDEPSWLEEIDIADGTSRTLVDARPLWSYYPAYAPDGTTVAFAVSPAHHAGEDWDLAVTDGDAPGGFRRLTEGAGNDRVPAW